VRVSAVIVTRGDVDLNPILESIPEEYETIVWDNGIGSVSRRVMKHTLARIVTGKGELDDFAVYGRYAAIDYASGDLIYVQDDDVLHTSEGIEEIIWQSDSGSAEYGRLVVNMPANFRHSFYREHALVGFGACFHRDLPERAFQRWGAATFHRESPLDDVTFSEHGRWGPLFLRTCDVVFTGLTPYTMVDVPYEDLPWASAPNRMWQQPQHREERGRMLDLVRKVRDG
jgi:hypothetical protein